MKKIFIILHTLFYASVCGAQVSDDFSDGNLTNNPEWIPDMPGNWVVENGQLRSNVSVANSAFYITTPSAKATEAQWEFWTNLQFNTSSANYADVFLMADQANLLSATLNGYFVRIGGTPDEISLYKIVNGIATILINGTDGVTNSSNNTVRIKVIRDADNNWTLQHDATGGAHYFEEGAVVDNTFTTSAYFGIRIQQSASGFFNRHFFDDIYAGEIIQPIPVSYKDVILTEIFADPSPQVGLPDAEFVEIYNRSTNSINLAGWKFTDGSSTATLTSRILLPGQYLILASNTSAALYSSFGNTLGASNFPTLNNAGETLMLRAPDNTLIDSVNFNTTWYRDEDKKEGGWTLELIDVNNPCGEEDNWTANETLQGGTPGYVNSVNTNKPDVTGPQLVSVTVTGTQELLLTFNEKLEKQISKTDFETEPAVEIESVLFTSASLRQVKLNLAGQLQSRKLYMIKVVHVRDCAGNSIQEMHNQKTFALSEAAEPGDVLLNEILFNPRPGGVDFVEIVNTSDKYINLKNWGLANYENEIVLNTRVLSTQDIVLSPGAFLAITPDGVILKNHYPLGIESNFLIATIPAMNDDAGSIALISDTGIKQDHLMYNDDFHTPILKDTEGISLERISTAEMAANRSNWRSASSAAGFATPGFINSNSKPHAMGDEEKITIDPEIFSPDRPGQDFAQIRYKFEQTGWVANIKIADQQGRVIKTLANNETLGHEGFFRWDGDREDGTWARMGYYFVWFEVFQLDGQVKTFRKRVVIAR